MPTFIITYPRSTSSVTHSLTYPLIHSLTHSPTQSLTHLITTIFAFRCRFVKRIYIPLPDTPGRAQLFHTLLRGSSHCLSAADIATLVQRSEGYSGADIRSLCTEAAMCPVRQAAAAARGNLRSLREEDVPPISQHHFLEALDNVACSVSQADLKRYIDWNAEFGSFRKLE